MKKIGVIFIIALVLIAGVVAYKMTGKTIDNKNTRVKLETTEGTIVIELYADKSPITVKNFLTYVKKDFYSNTIFHRIISDFMIQGGGIDSASGEEKTTNPPIKLESNNGLKNDRGTIAMARTQNPNSATAQFFINLKDNDFLNYGYRDEGYAVFGKVIQGMDVVDKIAKYKTDAGDKPLKEVKIISASVV